MKTIMEELDEAMLLGWLYIKGISNSVRLLYVLGL